MWKACTPSWAFVIITKHIQEARQNNYIVNNKSEFKIMKIIHFYHLLSLWYQNQNLNVFVKANLESDELFTIY